VSSCGARAWLEADLGAAFPTFEILAADYLAVAQGVPAQLSSMRRGRVRAGVMKVDTVGGHELGAVGQRRRLLTRAHGRLSR